MEFELRDADGNVLLTTLGKARDNQFWVNQTFAGSVVASVVDTTPSDYEPPKSDREMIDEQETNIKTLEAALVELTARVAALENI